MSIQDQVIYFSTLPAYEFLSSEEFQPAFFLQDESSSNGEVKPSRKRSRDEAAVEDEESKRVRTLVQVVQTGPVQQLLIDDEEFHALFPSATPIIESLMAHAEEVGAPVQVSNSTAIIPQSPVMARPVTSIPTTPVNNGKTEQHGNDSVPVTPFRQIASNLVPSRLHTTISPNRKRFTRRRVSSGGYKAVCSCCCKRTKKTSGKNGCHGGDPSANLACTWCIANGKATECLATWGKDSRAEYRIVN
jgi:hypothetical protein